MTDLARIHAAYDDLARIAGGWKPESHLWGPAPLFNRWCYSVHPLTGTMCLAGFHEGEPRRCSPVVAMRTGPAGIGWARTLTGWLRLAVCHDERHKEGDRRLPESARAIELAAFEAGYRAPRRSLNPQGSLSGDPGWIEAAEHIERTAIDPETAFAVFYARVNKISLDEARRAVANFWLARDLAFE